MSNRPEFDDLSASYEALLKDPIRDRFTGSQSEFFHVRKRDLILNYFRRRGIRTSQLGFMDLGCGKGELLKLLEPAFSHVSGCDVSEQMMRDIKGVDIRVQTDPLKIPFPDSTFDFVTAVCVYHHVPVDSRLELAREAFRVLRPGGTFAIIEHNPLNPVTRLIVSRTPIDADAILLRASETLNLMRSVGLTVTELEYFLFLPGPVYKYVPIIERILRKLPFGGQYGTFATKPVGTGL
jgi:SAM-dependent methyltransferase